MTNLEQARGEARIGRLWRAKEILGGALPKVGYDLELYEAYGQVLLQMHDDLEAGRFLFLSGVRKPEYEEAISLYLERHGHNGWQPLVGTFPHRARLAELHDYPETVRTELSQIGSPDTLSRDRGSWQNSTKPRGPRPRTTPSATNKLIGVGCIFVMIVFTTAAIVFIAAAFYGFKEALGVLF